MKKYILIVIVISSSFLSITNAETPQVVGLDKKVQEELGEALKGMDLNKQQLVAIEGAVVKILQDKVSEEPYLSKHKTLVAIIGAIGSLLLGLWLVFKRLERKELGFDTNSIKALGLVMFLPTLILAFSVKEGISSEALAALLGTVAGYILSRGSNENDQKGKASNKPL